MTPVKHWDERVALPAFKCLKRFQVILLQWNLFKADTFGTFPSVRLIEVCKIGAMFVND